MRNYEINYLIKYFNPKYFIVKYSLKKWFGKENKMLFFDKFITNRIKYLNKFIF